MSGGLNTFAYVGGSPAMYADPEGLAIGILVKQVVKTVAKQAARPRPRPAPFPVPPPVGADTEENCPPDDSKRCEAIYLLIDERVRLVKKRINHILKDRKGEYEAASDVDERFANHRAEAKRAQLSLMRALEEAHIMQFYHYRPDAPQWAMQPIPILPRRAGGTL